MKILGTALTALVVGAVALAMLAAVSPLVVVFLAVVYAVFIAPFTG